jgi:hypothetical protein
VVVRYGRCLEDGFLPVFSVADEEEARDLLIATCPTNAHGEFVARELVEEQTLENLQAFSDKLAKVHAILKEKGFCRCKLPESGRSGSRIRD